jgi:hypothetical protein
LEFFKLGGQGREQMLFGRKHRARFYGGGPLVCAQPLFRGVLECVFTVAHNCGRPVRLGLR